VHIGDKRFVESRGRLGFPEYIRNSVITNSVARTEIAVGIVIEGAPANPASILHIGRQLVMDAGMSQGVLGEALHLVDRLRGISVADKFRIQIPRMVRRSQRKTEIVHGEDVLQELRFLEVANSARLARGVKLMSQRVRASIEIMVVFGFVDAHTPEDDRGMIPVAANHAAYIVDGDLLPSFVADVLPAGDLFQNEKADFVAGVEKMT